MKKLFISLLALLVCSLCFADGFNYETLKNPPANIQFIDYKDGNVCYMHKARMIVPSLSRVDFMLFPNIIRISGQHKCQIRFASSIGYASEFSIKFKTGKIVKLNIKPKTFSSKDGNIVFYFIVCELPLQEYINYFVKDMPVAIRVKIPALDKSTCEITIDEPWRKSFDAMKPFFKLDNEVQVQFR